MTEQTGGVTEQTGGVTEHTGGVTEHTGGTDYGVVTPPWSRQRAR